jgi:hypothetical protein
MRDLNRISLAAANSDKSRLCCIESEKILLFFGLDWGEVAFAAQNSSARYRTKNSKQANHGDGRT